MLSPGDTAGMVVPRAWAAQRHPGRFGDDPRVSGSAEHQLSAPFAGVVVAIASPQERILEGQAVVVLEAMKMEHEILAETAGIVMSAEVAVGEAVQEGQLLMSIEASGDSSRR